MRHYVEKLSTPLLGVVLIFHIHLCSVIFIVPLPFPSIMNMTILSVAATLVHVHVIDNQTEM
jgi:hypothetical protein